jgi:hypothetical protein
MHKIDNNCINIRYKKAYHRIHGITTFTVTGLPCAFTAQKRGGTGETPQERTTVSRIGAYMPVRRGARKIPRQGFRTSK